MEDCCGKGSSNITFSGFSLGAAQQLLHHIWTRYTSRLRQPQQVDCDQMDGVNT